MIRRVELRCPGPTLHGVIDPEAKTIEVRCKRRRCGVRPGVVVLHTFALDSGRLLKTQKFRDPEKEVRNDTSHRTAVRSA